MADYTVLHGFQPSAGQPGIMAKALRSVGVDASSVIVGPNKFGYPSDFHFADLSSSTMHSVLSEFAAKTDVVHIHAVTPFYTKGRVSFPMGTELLALRAAGARIVMHFRGSEIRMPSLFRAHSPFHYVDDDTEGLVAKFSEDWQRDYLSMCQSLCDEIVVTDPELATYVPGAKVVARAIDMQQWQQVPFKVTQRPLVVHAPSRPGVKGTAHVLAAVKSLQAEGLDFDFQLIQGLSNAEARQAYEDADVIVDQLRIGWYGVLAVEAMALGKPVISYIREDLMSSFEGELPVAVATPLTIKDVLRELILSPSLREAQAEAGREYCCQAHDSVRVAECADTLYRSVLASPAKFDMRGYLSVNSRQEQASLALQADAKLLGAKNASKKAKIASAAKEATLPPVKKPIPATFVQRAKNAYRKEGISKFLRRSPGRVSRLLMGSRSTR